MSGVGNVNKKQSIFPSKNQKKTIETKQDVKETPISTGSSKILTPSELRHRSKTESTPLSNTLVVKPKEGKSSYDLVNDYIPGDKLIDQIVHAMAAEQGLSIEEQEKEKLALRSISDLYIGSFYDIPKEINGKKLTPDEKIQYLESRLEELHKRGLLNDAGYTKAKANLRTDDYGRAALLGLILSAPLAEGAAVSAATGFAKFLGIRLGLLLGPFVAAPGVRFNTAMFKSVGPQGRKIAGVPSRMPYPFQYQNEQPVEGHYVHTLRFGVFTYMASLALAVAFSAELGATGRLGLNFGAGLFAGMVTQLEAYQNTNSLKKYVLQKSNSPSTEVPFINASSPEAFNRVLDIADASWFGRAAILAKDVKKDLFSFPAAAKKLGNDLPAILGAMGSLFAAEVLVQQLGRLPIFKNDEERQTHYEQSVLIYGVAVGYMLGYGHLRLPMKGTAQHSIDLLKSLPKKTTNAIQAARPFITNLMRSTKELFSQAGDTATAVERDLEMGRESGHVSPDSVRSHRSSLSSEESETIANALALERIQLADPVDGGAGGYELRPEALGAFFNAIVTDIRNGGAYLDESSGNAMAAKEGFAVRVFQADPSFNRPNAELPEGWTIQRAVNKPKMKRAVPPDYNFHSVLGDGLCLARGVKIISNMRNEVENPVPSDDDLRPLLDAAAAAQRPAQIEADVIAILRELRPPREGEDLGRQGIGHGPELRSLLQAVLDNKPMVNVSLPDFPEMPQVDSVGYKDGARTTLGNDDQLTRDYALLHEEGNHYQVLISNKM